MKIFFFAGNEPLAFMFPVVGSNTRFIAGLGRKFIFVEWDGTSPEVSKVEEIVEIEKEVNLKDNRLNGAKIDPYGTLWAGKCIDLTNFDTFRYYAASPISQRVFCYIV